MQANERAALAAAKPRSKARDKGNGEPRMLARDDAAFVGAVGRLVRLHRAKRGMTRRQLAAESGASERYLAQIEDGQGNPSVIILKSILILSITPEATLDGTLRFYVP